MQTDLHLLDGHFCNEMRVAHCVGRIRARTSEDISVIPEGRLKNQVVRGAMSKPRLSTVDYTF